MTMGSWTYYLRRSLARTSLLKATVLGWWEDKAPRLGAALAFYTALSLAPMLVLVTPLIGAVFGQHDAREQIAAQFEQLAGKQGGDAVRQMLVTTAVKARQVAEGPAVVVTTAPTTSPATNPATAPASAQVATAPATLPAATAGDIKPPPPGHLATLLSVIVLLFAASGVFAELQDALNTVWGVAPKPGKAALWGFLRQRFLSFAMVMGIGFVLLVSLVLSAALEALQSYAWGRLDEMTFVWQAAHQLISLLVITVLFAMIFKVLPDATVAWRDVWMGAALTSGLFIVGRYLIGKYLGTFGVGARYGAAGSLVALLVWVYYSAQILLLGAEFTKASSLRAGTAVVSTDIAVPVTEEARAREGIPHKEVVEAVAKVVEEKEAAAQQASPAPAEKGTAT
jgi:membrane protein